MHSYNREFRWKIKPRTTHKKRIYDCCYMKLLLSKFSWQLLYFIHPDKGTLAKSESVACLWRDIKFIRSLRRLHNAWDKQFPFCCRALHIFPHETQSLRKLTPDKLLASTHHIKNNGQVWESVELTVTHQ